MIRMRKLRSVFVREEARDNNSNFWIDNDLDDPELRYLEDEVHEWCKNTFGRVPRIWFQEMFDDYDNYSNYEGWVINFNSESEEVAFKLKWHGWQGPSK
jgi:hypothetical protein